MARRSLDPVRGTTAGVQVLSVDAEGGQRMRPDRLATEEPMEIRIHGPREPATAVATTLRTPGHDFELALGFLFSEQILHDVHDLVQVAYCLGENGDQEYNVVTVRVRAPAVEAIVARPFVANSSCGLCGKRTLDDLGKHCDSLVSNQTAISIDIVRSLPDIVEQQQAIFDITGGIHAAALLSTDGVVRCVREDIGRHNAVDKVVGHALIERWLPLEDSVLFVSGRLGFELVQKAAMARIPIVCAVGAPSSMAIDTARQFGITVVAFVRDGRCNIYTSPQRILL